jgi:hypothetical protein
MHIIHDHQLPPSDLVILAKKKSSNKKKDVFYVLPVVDLRRVADEMKATYEFVMGLSLYSFRVWYESKDPSTRTGVLQEVIAAAGPNTLPEKPPRPDKLTPLELEEGR